MKKIINLLLALVLTANLAACWTEDIPRRVRRATRSPA